MDLSLIKKFWEFLKKDTWQSWLVSVILIIILIKLIIFPTLTFITGSPLPLVVVESCSMYHEAPLEEWTNKNSAYYESFNISQSDFQDFPMKNGLNKGDIIFVWGKSTSYNVGDIIIFQPNSEALTQTPIIHRIITDSPIGTKGDHNSQQLQFANNINNIDETSITKSQIIGKASFKVLPFVGWIKLIFFEPFRPDYQRGLCK